jgi:TRAP-type C4-dicarboxylate transport system permease small subunit
LDGLTGFTVEIPLCSLEASEKPGGPMEEKAKADSSAPGETPTPSKFIERFSWYGGAMGAGMVIAMALMVFSGIVARYLGRPLTFTDEYAGYLIVGVTYLGITWAYVTGRIVSVDFLVKRLPPVIRHYVLITWEGLALAYIAVLAYETIRTAHFQFVNDIRATSMTRTPLWIPDLAIILGLIFLGISIFLVITRKLRAGPGKGGAE